MTMPSTRDGFHPTRFEDLAVTVEFHCNSACRFCIVQEGMNRYRGLSLERFREVVDENRRSGKYQRLILTGGEVTLEKRLFDFLQLARDSGSFRHVRVQTNARRLADAAYARSLAEAGVDELFVSIHGHDAATHDDITQRPGSFAELLAGLRNARALGQRLITNTVMTRRNVRSLPALVPLAIEHGVARMELWNYLPMEDAEDARDLIAPMDELVPPLVEALGEAAARGMPCTVKYVPRCLLGAHGALLDNGQPDVVIVEDFWDQFPRFACLYEAVCEHSDECLGLHHPYVNKHGWEADRLAPEPRTRPWAERVAPPAARPERDATPAAAGHPAWLALVEGAADAAGAILERVDLTRTHARYAFTLGDGAVEVVLAGRDDAQPALARTRSFNLFYTSARGTDTPATRAMLERLLSEVRDRVRARDDGTLALDARKGLVQLLPPARQRPRR